MGKVYDATVRYLTRSGWSYAPVEDGISIALRFAGDDGEWSCVVQALEDQAIFLFFSVLPEDAPAERRTEVAEFVTRANYGMLTGAFEFSLDTGDVRYRTGVRLSQLPDTAWGDDQLAERMIDEVVRANVITMDAYLAGLRAVLHGRPAAAAIDQIERGGTED
jgi:hypothetical protein